MVVTVSYGWSRTEEWITECKSKESVKYNPDGKGEIILS